MYVYTALPREALRAMARIEADNDEVAADDWRHSQDPALAAQQTALRREWAARFRLNTELQFGGASGRAAGARRVAQLAESGAPLSVAGIEARLAGE